MMTLRNQILTLFLTYSKLTGRSQSRISGIIWQGGGVIKRVTEGGDVSTGNFEKAVQWFSDNWPPGKRWPKGIKRPKKSAPNKAA